MDRSSAGASGAFEVAVAGRLLLCLLGSCNLGQDVAIGQLASPEVRRRAEAALRLGSLGDESAVRHLERSLEDPAPDVRRSAIGALVRLSERKVAPYKRVAVRVSETVDDPSAEVRLAAVRALGELGRREHRRTLLPRLSDPVVPVRHAAARALERLGMPRAEQIRSVADQRRRMLRARMETGGEQALAAARLLVDDDDTEAARLLFEAVSSATIDEVEASAIARELGRASTREPTLMASLDPKIRASYLEGLSDSTRPDRATVLVKALADSSPVVRRAAATALGRVAEAPRTIGPLCGRLVDSDGDVVLAAARSLDSLDESCGPDAHLLGATAPLESLALRARHQAVLSVSLATRLAREPGDPAAWLAASRVLYPDVGRALWQVAQRERRARQDEATRWISSSGWAALAQSEDEAPAPPPSSALPRGLRAEEALAEILRRFPPRGRSEEIWPTRSDPERVRASLAAALLAAPDDLRGVIRKEAVSNAASADPALRIAAAGAFALLAPDALGRPPVGPALDGLASDSEHRVRSAAAAPMATRRDADWLTRLLRDDVESVRQAAAVELARTAVPVAPAVLRECLKRDGTAAAARALARVLRSDAGNDLAAILRADGRQDDSELRLAALDELAAIGSSAEIAVIGTALDDVDPAVRAASARTLSKLGGARARSLLEEHRDDFSAEVRRAVLDGLRGSDSALAPAPAYWPRRER